MLQEVAEGQEVLGGFDAKTLPVGLQDGILELQNAERRDDHGVVVVCTVAPLRLVATAQTQGVETDAGPVAAELIPQQAGSKHSSEGGLFGVGGNDRQDFRLAEEKVAWLAGEHFRWCRNSDHLLNSRPWGQANLIIIA